MTSGQPGQPPEEQPAQPAPAEAPVEAENLAQEGPEGQPPEAATPGEPASPGGAPAGPQPWPVLAVVGERILGFPSVLAAVQSHNVGLSSRIFTDAGQFYHLGEMRYVNQFFSDAPPEMLVSEDQLTPAHLQALWAHLQGKAVIGTIAHRAYGSEEESDMAGKKKDKEPRNGDGRRGKNADKRITVVAEGNPKREGSAAYSRFKLYKDGMTVAEFIKKGGTSGDVNYDLAHKYISLSD